MKFGGFNITIKQIRIAIIVTIVCCASVLAKYYAGYRKRPLTKQELSALQHSKKIQKYTFAGEIVPFDSPVLLKRYQRAISENKKPSISNLMMIKASKRWFPLMEPILKKYKIPNDFKYISTAESKLTLAFSKKGAGGFWQMMPATARGLGLEVNDEVDERFHPIKSTEVACKLLKSTYKIFNDWTSVALAYNMGSTALYRAKRIQKLDNVHFIRSNKETERYFFLVMASKDLIENAPKYGYRIRKSGKVSEVKVVEVNENIPSLTQFAASHGSNLATLKSFNPWLRTDRLTIKPEFKTKKYQIILPLVHTIKPNELEEDFVQDTISKKTSKKDTTFVR
jgi:membrane-bound lytic murein transglycosylase D